MKVLARRGAKIISLCFLLLCLWSGGCARKEIAPVFDASALMGRDIQEATKVLGQPSRNIGSSEASGQAQRVWVRDGVTLNATYKVSSGRVLRWNLLVRSPKDALRDSDKAKLLQAARARENDAAYSVEYIEAPERPMFYVGAGLIPAPRQHTVILRVTGTQAMLQVSAQPVQPGEDATFITIPTWEKSFSAPDDAQLSLSSGIIKNLQSGSAFSMKIEIVVDGKVVKSASSTGQPIEVRYEI